MKRAENKSHCPVNYALEAFGDSWSLLIVRDIVYWGKHTYGEFLESAEGIATNMLATRLSQLEQKGIISKSPHPTDKRKEMYNLTDKGLDLVPILLEMSNWSTIHDSETTAPQAFVATIRADRNTWYPRIRQTIANGGSLFAGPGSVLDQMALKESTHM